MKGDGDSQATESEASLKTGEVKGVAEEEEPTTTKEVGFVIKEWCVHSDKDLKLPDCVKPKGTLLAMML